MEAGSPSQPPDPRPKSSGPSGRLIGKRTPKLPDAVAAQEDTLREREPTRVLEQIPDGAQTLDALPGKEDTHTIPWLKQPGGPSSIPERLGQYEVRGEVARGGMGVVLRGFHTELKREVAIKLLRSDVAAIDEQARARFMLEARATAKLRHPGIVAIHDVGTDPDGRPYLVMDFVKGQDLSDVLAAGPLAPKHAAQLIQKVCWAVAHAHEHGILHRDLKPHNVLIDGKSGEPLLTDFGLAKWVGMQTTSGNTARVGRRRKVDSDHDVKLTLDGEVMGTPLYMAPEQVNTSLAKVSAKTDVYALGAVLYECLTGQPPFDGEGVFEIFEKLLHDRAVPPRQLRPDVPVELEIVCMRALEKSPLSRYRSAEEMAKDLGRFLAGVEVLGQTIHRRPEAQRSWGRRLLLLAVLVAVATVLALALGPDDLGQRVTLATRALFGDPPQSLPQPRDPVAASSSDVALLPPAALAQPPVAAHRLRRLALDGDVNAMHDLGLLIIQRKLEDRPPELGIHWLEKAALAGHSEAHRSLGIVYYRGIGVPSDMAAAALWFRQGVELGRSTCVIPLVNCLIGEGTDSAYREAARLLQPLAEAGNLDAQVTLGSLHTTGAEWADRELGRRHLADAAGQGSPSAMMQLASLCERDSEFEACRGWLKEAARAGNADAMFALGQAYELGSLGLEPKLERARRWYQRALEAGHDEAKLRLEEIEARERG